jgi:hypothetical protein
VLHDSDVACIDVTNPPAFSATGCPSSVAAIAASAVPPPASFGRCVGPPPSGLRPLPPPCSCSGLRPCARTGEERSVKPPRSRSGSHSRRRAGARRGQRSGRVGSTLAQSTAVSTSRAQATRSRGDAAAAPGEDTPTLSRSARAVACRSSVWRAEESAAPCGRRSARPRAELRARTFRAALRGRRPLFVRGAARKLRLGASLGARPRRPPGGPHVRSCSCLCCSRSALRDARDARRVPSASCLPRTRATSSEPPSPPMAADDRSHAPPSVRDEE